MSGYEVFPYQINACQQVALGQITLQDYTNVLPHYAERIVAPRECAGDIHVFPCPHCDKCKCGSATKIRAKGKP